MTKGDELFGLAAAVISAVVLIGMFIIYPVGVNGPIPYLLFPVVLAFGVKCVRGYMMNPKTWENCRLCVSDYLTESGAVMIDSARLGDIVRRII